MKHVSFTDFVLGLSSLKFPLNINQWTDYFEHFFRNVKTHKGPKLDIQMSMCDAYKIDFDYVTEMDFLRRAKTAHSTATLFLSKELFYLLIDATTDHIIMSTGANLLSSGATPFNALGGGRFRSSTNSVVVSYEQDEFDNFFILTTSMPTLLTFDELFNTARQVLRMPL